MEKGVLFARGSTTYVDWCSLYRARAWSGNIVVATRFPDGSARARGAFCITFDHGRITQVVPSSRPFLAGLYGALAGSLNAARLSGREAPPGRVATRRYRHCAEWLVALLSDRPGLPLTVSSEVQAKQVEFSKDIRVEFDASPWGGAGIYNEEGTAMEYFVVTWTRNPQLGVDVGNSAFQTFWELLTLALCLQRWCPIRADLLFCGG